MSKIKLILFLYMAMENDEFLSIMNVEGASQDFSSFVEKEHIPSPTIKLTAKRSKNFTHGEDQLLVSAWLNVSMDSTVGVEQNHSTYWNRVHAYFHEFKQFESDRNALSLQNRWSDIQKATSKFASCVVEIARRNQSGTNPRDKLINSCTLYKAKEKKAFPFLHC